jgi:hypothetical protein
VTAHRIPIPLGEMLLGQARALDFAVWNPILHHSERSRPDRATRGLYTVKNDNITREEFFYDAIF